MAFKIFFEIIEKNEKIMTFLNVKKLQKIHNSNIGECSAPKCNAASIVENALYYKLLCLSEKVT